MRRGSRTCATILDPDACRGSGVRFTAGPGRRHGVAFPRLSDLGRRLAWAIPIPSLILGRALPGGRVLFPRDGLASLELVGPVSEWCVRRAPPEFPMLLDEWSGT
jgi:hypothetical protein